MGVRYSKWIPVIVMVLLFLINYDHLDSIALNKLMVFFCKDSVFC